MIDARNITKTFGGISAIRDCSLRVREGTITGLIGPNGAGKTTLFNVMAGFFAPDSGHILFRGEDVTGMSPHRLFERGLMRTFQIPRVFDRMTVRENLMVVPSGQSGENVLAAWFAHRRVRAQDLAIARRADEVIAFLGLGPVAGQLAGTLSGGQKKLVELGRTMMSDCRTILLDEPGAGVNRTLLNELVANIRRLNRELGFTFCIIEHDMDVVAQLCDPVIVMAEGRVIAEGRFDEVRRDRTVIDAYFGHGEAEPAGRDA
jgi:branched-chain amino acid transport system ATP-binding protein